MAEILPDLVRVFNSLLAIGPAIEEFRVHGLEVDGEVTLGLGPKFDDLLRPFGKRGLHFLEHGFRYGRTGLLYVQPVTLSNCVEVMDDFRRKFGHMPNKRVRFREGEDLYLTLSHETASGPAASKDYLKVSKTEILRSCAKRSKNGIAFRTV